jgi:glycosyltransferase involved in cell wall biosynthesis
VFRCCLLERQKRVRLAQDENPCTLERPAVTLSDTAMPIREFVAQPRFDPAVLAAMDPSYPRISIVMPVYNQAAFLERSILSVLNQNYPNLELLVIDGGSTDGSVEIAQRYQKYFHHWESERDRGQSHALNKGFACATGEVYGWMNSDDLYAPGALVCVAQALRSRSDVVAVYGDIDRIDEHDRQLSRDYAFDFSVNHLMFESWHLGTQALFWRRAAHLKCGEFDETLHRTMDYDFILRLGLAVGANRFYRVSRVLGCFRRHADQKTRGPDRVSDAENRAIAFKLHFSAKYRPVGRLLRLIFRLRRAYWYVKRGGIRYLLGKLKGRIARTPGQSV